jgi:hypothetical protein
VRDVEPKTKQNKKRISKRVQLKEIFLPCTLGRNRGTGSKVHSGIQIASLNVLGAQN